MAHPHIELVANAYKAINRRDLDGFLAAFAPDAVMYGADGQIEGKEAIGSVIQQLIRLSDDTLRIEIHDILANDDHTVVLQITTAQLDGRRLADRVVYVFHVEDGLIKEAFFSGDPRIQSEFYGID